MRSRPGTCCRAAAGRAISRRVSGWRRLRFPRRGMRMDLPSRGLSCTASPTRGSTGSLTGGYARLAVSDTRHAGDRHGAADATSLRRWQGCAHRVRRLGAPNCEKSGVPGRTGPVPHPPPKAGSILFCRIRLSIRPKIRWSSALAWPQRATLSLSPATPAKADDGLRKLGRRNLVKDAIGFGTSQSGNFL